MADDPKPGSPLGKWMLLRAIVADQALPRRAIQAGFWLLDRFNGQTGRCFPSYTTLANDIGCNITTAKRAVNALVKRGWFTCRRGGGAKGNSNIYEPSWGRIEPVASTPPVASMPPVGDANGVQGVAATPLTGGGAATWTGGESATQNYELKQSKETMNGHSRAFGLEGQRARPLP